MSTVLRLKSNDVWFPELPDLLDEATNNYNLVEQPEWRSLAELSVATSLEGIDVYGDSAVIEGNKYVAPGSVFVELVYELGKDDNFSFHDSYPVRVFFTFNSDTDIKSINVEKIEIDTRSFFE